MQVTIMYKTEEREVDLPTSINTIRYATRRDLPFSITSQDICNDDVFYEFTLDELNTFMESYICLDSNDTHKVEFMLDNGYSEASEVLDDINSVEIYRNKTMAQTVYDVVQEISDNPFILGIIDTSKGEVMLTLDGYEQYGDSTFKRNL